MIKIENLTRLYRTPTGRHYVFRGLNVEIPSGKSIAFISRNGAGKSTLLRMISDTDRLDSGGIITNKAISRLVGLAGRFQGSLTGHENVKFVVRLCAKQEELKERIELVEGFAGLGKYSGMPIETYSSGMQSRLGFGLSMAFKLDYYIVDEVTAVGDARFKERYAQLFKERHKESSFLMVLHSLNSLKEFCDVMIIFKNSYIIGYCENVQSGISEYKVYQALGVG